jgi:hypothetical protein
MEPPPAYSPRPLLPRDSDVTSIRSAAPSYVSNAPSYISIEEGDTPRASGLPSPYQSNPSSIQHPRTNSTPSLDSFRISSWSRIQSSNPTARHYHSIASRRASTLTLKEQASLLAAALNGDDGIAQMKKKMDEEERQRAIRTNEDPYLVGEQAAEQNRQERLKRENGLDVLELEDKRWNWLLSQMSDWEERDQSWRKFRKDIERGNKGKLAKRLGLGKA